MQVLIAGAAYAVATLLGTLLGRAICNGRAGFDDGPAPIRVDTRLLVAAGALVGCGIAAHGMPSAQLITVAVVVVFLAACAVADCTCGIVPDLFTLVPLGALVVSAGARRDFAPLVSAVIVAVPFVAAALASRGRGMGWGDVKLAALAGALLGARDATLALVVACIAALIFSRVQRLHGRPMAFAPYLVAAIGLQLAVGPLF